MQFLRGGGWFAKNQCIGGKAKKEGTQTVWRFKGGGGGGGALSEKQRVDTPIPTMLS